MPTKRCSLYQNSQRLNQRRRRGGVLSVIIAPKPGIDVNIEVRDGGLQLVAHGGSVYSLHAPAILEPTDKEEEWLVRGGRAAGEIALFKFDDDSVTSYELGAFVFKKLV